MSFCAQQPTQTLVTDVPCALPSDRLPANAPSLPSARQLATTTHCRLPRACRRASVRSSAPRSTHT